MLINNDNFSRSIRRHIFPRNIEIFQIRVLKYKLSTASKELDFSDTAINGSPEFLHSTKLAESTPVWHSKISTSELQLKENMQLIIEENEALRTGMHEILDSIRNQDGEFSLI